MGDEKVISPRKQQKHETKSKKPQGHDSGLAALIVT